MIISNNVRNITLLDGYECILSSTDMAGASERSSVELEQVEPGESVRTSFIVKEIQDDINTDNLTGNNNNKYLRIRKKERQTGIQRKQRRKRYYTTNPYTLK